MDIYQRAYVLNEIHEIAETAVKDTENAHKKADDLLCRILVEHGYELLVDVFKKMKKWYA